jgi:hypothetical protein
MASGDVVPRVQVPSEVRSFMLRAPRGAASGVVWQAIRVAEDSSGDGVQGDSSRMGCKGIRVGMGCKGIRVG